MHNNTNSTYFSHFWSNIKRNKWQNKRTPTLFSQKSSAHSDTAAFSPWTMTRRTTNAKKICCTITHITETQYCPTKHSKIDDIRIRRHNTHAVTDKNKLGLDNSTDRQRSAPQQAIQAVKVIVRSYVTSHDYRPPHPLPAQKWNFHKKNTYIAHLKHILKCFTIVISCSKPSVFFVFSMATVSALPGCPASLFYVVCVFVLVCFKAHYNTYVHTHTCARKFWYFPLLKHGIYKKINKLLNIYYASVNVYIKFYNRSSKGY